jgi:septal ring factor EnvC (AmiA/AmiB activator)
MSTVREHDDGDSTLEPGWPNQRAFPAEGAPAAPAPKRRRRGLRILGVGLLIIAFGALAAGALYFSDASDTNRRAAERWRERARAAQKLLDARTDQLDRRTAALNRTVEALERSERDVQRLEERQRALADEKAQVEDQRGELVVQASLLTQLAQEQRACSDGLAELLNDMANEDYAAIELYIADVADDCATARAGFEAFQARYGVN